MWLDHTSVWMHVYRHRYIYYMYMHICVCVYIIECYSILYTANKNIIEYYSNQNILLYFFVEPEYLKALCFCLLKTIAALMLYFYIKFLYEYRWVFLYEYRWVICWDSLSPVFLEIWQCTAPSHFSLQYLWLKFKFLGTRNLICL